MANKNGRTLEEIASEIFSRVSYNVQTYSPAYDLDGQFAELYKSIHSGMKELISEQEMPLLIVEYCNVIDEGLQEWARRGDDAAPSVELFEEASRRFVAFVRSLPRAMRIAVSLNATTPVRENFAKLGNSFLLHLPDRTGEYQSAKEYFPAVVAHTFQGLPLLMSHFFHSYSRGVDALKAFLGLALVRGFATIDLFVNSPANKNVATFLMDGTIVEPIISVADGEFERFAYQVVLQVPPRSLLSTEDRKLSDIASPWVNLVLENPSADSHAVQSACQSLIDGDASSDKSRKLLHYCFGLEKLLGEPTSTESKESFEQLGLTTLMADRCAFYLASTIEARVETRTAFRKIYRMRSKLAHGNVRRLSVSEIDSFKDARAYLVRIIRAVSDRLAAASGAKGTYYY
jgi:hypothetical protein